MHLFLTWLTSHAARACTLSVEAPAPNDARVSLAASLAMFATRGLLSTDGALLADSHCTWLMCCSDPLSVLALVVPGACGFASPLGRLWPELPPAADMFCSVVSVVVSGSVYLVTG